jgi:hypothetical protein
MEPCDITSATVGDCRLQLFERRNRCLGAVSDLKPFGPARLQFALISILLLTCVGPAGTQTLRSSNTGSLTSPNGLTDGANSTHSAAPFGSVNEAVSDLVDASVRGYTSTIGEYMGVATGSGQSGKSAASLARLQPASSAASMLSHEMQGMRSHDIRVPSGVAQKKIAKSVLDSAAKPPLGVRTAVRSGMQPGKVSDIEEQGAQSKEADATESGATAFETTAFPEDRESISDPFRTQLGTSFEGLCSQYCGALSNSSPAGGGPTTANGERAVKDRLSSRATRLRVSDMAGDEEGRKTRSVLGSRRVRPKEGLSTQGKRSVHRELSGRR